MAPFKFQEKAMETLISTETDEGINNIANAFIKKNIGEKLIENTSNDQHVIKNKIITSIKISKINGLKQVGDDIRTMIFETKGRLRNDSEPDRVYNIGKSEVFLRNGGKMHSKRLIDENSNNLAVTCGLTFGKDTNPKKIRQMIEAHMVPVTFNEKFNRCRGIVENRLAASPLIGSRYFSLMLSDEMRKARAVLAEEAKAKEESIQQKGQSQKESASEVPKNASDELKSNDKDNVIEVDFTTGEVK